ncbi:MAG: hypothetical protein RRB13_12265 [bacterium]|nr:hypothetical protein [bacterium]
MKAKRVAKERYSSNYAKRVINICFDERSLTRIQPGLKLVYAPEDPPLFIEIDEYESGPLDAAS